MDMVYGHGLWTWSMDMVYGHGLWTWFMDMVYGHGHGHGHAQQNSKLNILRAFLYVHRNSFIKIRSQTKIGCG